MSYKNKIKPIYSPLFIITTEKFIKKRKPLNSNLHFSGISSRLLGRDKEFIRDFWFYLDSSLTKDTQTKPLTIVYRIDSEWKLVHNTNLCMYLKTKLRVLLLLLFPILVGL